MDTDIPKRLEEARIKAGLTQEQLAQRLNIKRSTYQYWEKVAPSLNKLEKVAKALGLPNDYFFVKASASGSSQGTSEASGTLTGKIEITIADYLESIKEQKRMAEQYNKELNEIIIIHLKGIERRLTGVDTSLTMVLSGVTKNTIHFEAASSTALESLSRLEKKSPGALQKEVDKKVFDQLKENALHRSQSETRTANKEA